MKRILIEINGSLEQAKTENTHLKRSRAEMKVNKQKLGHHLKKNTQNQTQKQNKKQPSNQPTEWLPVIIFS